MILDFLLDHLPVSLLAVTVLAMLGYAVARLVRAGLRRRRD